MFIVHSIATDMTAFGTRRPQAKDPTRLAIEFRQPPEPFMFIVKEPS
jgi:hypothetical protein